MCGVKVEHRKRASVLSLRNPEVLTLIIVLTKTACDYDNIFYCI